MVDGQTASLIVAKQDTTAANLLAEDLTLDLKILDLLLLLPAHVLTEDDEHHVQGWRRNGIGVLPEVASTSGGSGKMSTECVRLG